ncbi:hypothetical protein GQ44DRAFT_766649 [Phaeosphaeriaceae sp. PMI808]|nr:hypothetical protein GQ44DRAFT_766649 [Phaeosphaeriaceae sp. PMI808]
MTTYYWLDRDNYPINVKGKWNSARLLRRCNPDKDESFFLDNANIRLTDAISSALKYVSEYGDPQALANFFSPDVHVFVLNFYTLQPMRTKILTIEREGLLVRFGSNIATPERSDNKWVQINDWHMSEISTDAIWTPNLPSCMPVCAGPGTKVLFDPYDIGELFGKIILRLVFWNPAPGHELEIEAFCANMTRKTRIQLIQNNEIL